MRGHIPTDESHCIWEILSFLVTQSQTRPQFLIMSFQNMGLDIYLHTKLTNHFGFWDYKKGWLE